MGSFGGPGGSVFGGPGNGSSQSTAGTPLSGIIMPAYRIAGIQRVPMAKPNPEMYGEAIPELNRMLGSYNIDGHKIYSTDISDPLPLTNGQKIYTIGPGGDLDMERPNFIRGANVLWPTTPIVRRRLKILSDDEWRHISIQDLPGAPPWQLYYDGGMDGNGRGKVYIRFQPPDGYSLELYTWMRYSNVFTQADDIAVWPDGVNDLMVYQLAKRLAALNPERANMSPQSYTIAAQLLSSWIAKNSKSPEIGTDPALSREEEGPVGYGWLDGGFV